MCLLLIQLYYGLAIAFHGHTHTHTQLAVKAVPYRQDFLVVLGSDGSLEGEEAVIADMLSFAHSLGQINNILNGFYQKQNLDTPPEI